LLYSFPSAYGNSTVVDGENEAVYVVTTGTSLYTGIDMVHADATTTGGFPKLAPNQTNRFVFFKYDGTAAGYNEILKADTCMSVSVYYLPRYLHVRPATT
jgi:hypothetical protein